MIDYVIGLDGEHYYNDMLKGHSEISSTLNFDEIFKLDRMLTEKSIPHTMRRIHDGYQVIYPSKEEDETICDAVIHFFSYGHEDGTLEIMGLLTDEEEEIDTVLGHLTADEVFERIQKDWERRNEQNS